MAPSRSSAPLISSVSLASVTAMALSALVFTTPAVANGVTVLPDDANTTNQDGIIALVCPNGDYQVWAPVPEAETPDPGAPNESRYAAYQWNGEIFLGTTAPGTPEAFSTTSKFGGDFDPSHTGLRLIDFANGTINDGSANFPLDASDVVTVSLTATGTQPNESYAVVPALPAADNPSGEVLVQATVLSPPPGSGSAADPYRVGTADELNFLRCDLDAYYTLTADISLDRATFGYWLPVGGSGFHFAGVLRGGGHVISGLETPPLTDSDVGFIGRSGSGHLENLTLRSAVIQSTGIRVGVLAGSIQDNATVRNVTVESSTVLGREGVGLLTGFIDDGVVIRHSEASGTVTTPNLWTRTYEASDSMGTGTVDRTRFEMPLLDRRFDNSKNISRIGGFIGETEDTGLLVSQVAVDANVILPNRDKPEQNVGLGLVNAQFVGGFVGEADGGETLIEFVSSSATVDVLVGRWPDDQGSSRIGGFAGVIDETAVTDISAFANVTVGWQGNADPGELFDVGGFVGQMNSDNTMARVVSDSTLTIQSTDESSMTVSRVGGFAGYVETNMGLFSIQSTATVEIDSPTPISQVGGFAGRLRNNTGVLDVFAGATITSESLIDQLGGFAGLADNRFTGTSVIVAATFDVPADSTNFDPVIGLFENTNQIPGALVCTYYDQTLNPATVQNSFFTDSVADADFPAGVAATTAQLKDQSFLEQDSCFDFDNVWVSVAGEYPQLRQARILTSAFDATDDATNGTSQEGGATSGGTSGGSSGGTASASPSSKTLAATGVSIGLFATLSGFIILLGSILVARRNIGRMSRST